MFRLWIPFLCMFRLWMPFSCMLTVLVCSDSQRLFLVCSDCESLLFVYLNCECLFCVCMCRLWTPFLVCSDCQRLFLACPDCECLFSFLFRLWLPFSCMFRLWTPFSCIFRLWTPFPCMVRLWTPFLCIRIQTVDAYPPTLPPLFFFLVWASALCTFYNNPAPLNGSMQFHYCTLVTSRELEQTTLLFWSAACGVTPHGLHTADRR